MKRFEVPIKSLSLLLVGGLASAGSAYGQGLGDSVSYLFESSFSSATPNVSWQVSSALTAGLADFLFEVLVSNPHISPTQFQEHFYHAVESRLLQKVQDLHSLQPNETAYAAFDVVNFSSGFTCQSPNCESFELSKVVQLLLPAQITATWQGRTESGVVSFFVSHMPQARVYSYNSGSGDQIVQNVSSFRHSLRYEVQCDPGLPCQGARVK